jgi:kynureninase
VATRGEFDSIDVILRQYALRKRIGLNFVEARGDGLFEPEALLAAMHDADLVVLSQVLFNTGQVLPALPELIAAAHAGGARVLLDVYHSLAVLPVDIAALDADFAIGGSYKYLRGGPGACFLYLHPRHLDGSLRTLDIGWFAKREPFAYRRPDPPELAEGGNAFLESTPPVLTWYQARAGQTLALALGPARIRAYSLQQQQRLVGLLAGYGLAARGGDDAHGAFVVKHDPDAESWCERLLARGVVTDARGRYLRACPDILTTDAELTRAAEVIAETR